MRQISCSLFLLTPFSLRTPIPFPSNFCTHFLLPIAPWTTCIYTNLVNFQFSLVIFSGFLPVPKHPSLILIQMFLVVMSSSPLIFPLLNICISCVILLIRLFTTSVFCWPSASPDGFLIYFYSLDHCLIILSNISPFLPVLPSSFTRAPFSSACAKPQVGRYSCV